MYNLHLIRLNIMDGLCGVGGGGGWLMKLFNKISLPHR
jgi:hypothetical protein